MELESYQEVEITQTEHAHSKSLWGTKKSENSVIKGCNFFFYNTLFKIKKNKGYTHIYNMTLQYVSTISYIN